MLNIRRSRFLRRKSFLGKILRLPFRLIPAQAVIPILRGPLRGTRWIKGSHNLSVLLGTYERKQSFRFIEMARSASVFWDLGAHVGYYTLLFRCANSNGRTIAFEPLPANVAFFTRHMTLNNNHAVDLFPMAVSDTAGILRFDTGKTTVAGKLADTGLHEVDVIRLSEWVASGKIPPPDLIKMDIEGQEYKVLKDIRDLLEFRRPVLFLSTHGSRVHEDCVDFLKEMGYSIRPLDVPSLEESRELLAFS